MNYITVTADVNIDDILSELSSRQRETLYDGLREEFETKSSGSFSEGATYTEQELGKALNQIWQDRSMLTKSQRERIIAITTESFVEQ
jgi:hypothetical protein